MKKKKTGKWIQHDLKVRWFCRNCHQKGLAGIAIHHNTKGEAFLKDVLHIIRVTCHTDCHEPDIRLHFDTVSQLIH